MYQQAMEYLQWFVRLYIFVSAFAVVGFLVLAVAHLRNRRKNPFRYNHNNDLDQDD